uniref:Type IV pilus assembly protein PilM n=1 Tax=Eiseniibacteriota bacterium TaxID=2212470 RepID=A0A832I457_UNCEI
MRASLRSRPWAGLDIGQYSVKLLALQPGVGGARHWLAEVPLPPAPRPDTAPAHDAVARAVAAAFQQAGLPMRGLRGLALGIAGADVFIKQIHLPLLADDEIGPALRFEARKHLPFDPQTMVIDWQVIGRYPGDRRLEVLLAAVAQDRLARALEPLAALGIEADIVDAAPLALTNALSHGREAEREAHCLLDIGHTASHLTLWQRGEPYFSRRLDVGGRTLTQAIADATRVPFEEAEEWKLAAGSDQPGFRVDWSSPEMSALLEGLKRHLVDDLLRSLAFYRTIGRLPDPMKMWISGGTARLPGLAARLSDLLGFPVLLFDPLERHDGVPPGAGPQFAQAYGLALRSA